MNAERKFYTMDERRARGETIINSHGVELVHGRVLAMEALADYEKLAREHNQVWFSMSPFRSDYAELCAAIEQDLLEAADELAGAIKTWLEDDEWTATERGYAIDRVAEAS